MLLNGNQYDYLKNSYTEQALVNITEQICISMDESEVSILVLIDRFKAVDRVNHDLLLHNLVQLSTDNTWFEGYLN